MTCLRHGSRCWTPLLLHSPPPGHPTPGHYSLPQFPSQSPAASSFSPVLSLIHATVSFPRSQLDSVLLGRMPPNHLQPKTGIRPKGAGPTQSLTAFHLRCHVFLHLSWTYLCFPSKLCYFLLLCLCQESSSSSLLMFSSLSISGFFFLQNSGWHPPCEALLLAELGTPPRVPITPRLALSQLCPHCVYLFALFITQWCHWGDRLCLISC